MFSSTSSPPDSGRIRCVCDYDEDDGFTIQCEQCLVWQHAKCVGISKTSVPEQYFCEECKPGWHEDLHNLAFKAINLDVMVAGSTGGTTAGNTTNTTNAPFNVNIIEESGSTPVQAARPIGFKRRISVPAGVPALNEISENIISNDAQPLIDAFLKGINVPRLKRQQQAQDPNLLNFEFQATAVMDSPEHLALLQKSLEVREIRNRGYQKKGSSTKYGLFATEYCDPGHFVCEFIGHLQLKTLLSVKGAKEVPVSVTQSYVLYPLASIDLAVDARKFGTGARYARRSCRPNVQIKPIIVETGSGEYSLSWGLFARNVIKANSEILLPLDYQCGNGLFRYECACNAPDFCLGPLDNFKDTSVNITSNTSAATATVQRAASPKPAAFVESAELEALGIRRSSSAVLQDSQAAPSVATRPILDSRKLSREERKLQKYIEYFEKMDNADAAKKVTANYSSNSSVSSRKGSSSGSSPQPASRNSSPGKPGAGLKKAWKQLFSSDGSLDGGDDISSDNQVDAKEDSVIVKPAKRGRKPAAAKTQSEPGESVNEMNATSPQQSSPLKPKTPSVKTSPSKRKNSKADVAIIDEDSGGEIDVGDEDENVMVRVPSAAEKSGKVKKAKVDKQPQTKPSAKKKKLSEPEPELPVVAATTTTTTSPIIDIERSSSVLNASVAEQVDIPALPDTPSKKKLSLSDYLKKKKASPVESVPLNFDDNEEGEISREVFGSSSSGASSPQRSRADQVVSDYNFLTSAVVSNPVAVSKGPEEGESMRDYLRHSMMSDLHTFDDLHRSGSSSVRDLRDARYNMMDNVRDASARDNRDRDRDRDGRDRIDRVDIMRSSSSRELDSRDSRDSRDVRYTRDSRDVRDTRDWDTRDPRDSRDARDDYSHSSRYSRPSHLPSQSQSQYPQYSQYRPPSVPSQSIVEPMRHRERDDRDKEFDRLQREREFERREAERELERRERERDGRHYRYEDNRPAASSGGGYRPYRPHSGPGQGYQGQGQGYQGYNQHHHSQQYHNQQYQNQHHPGQQRPPPGYRPNNPQSQNPNAQNQQQQQQYKNNKY